MNAGIFVFRADAYLAVLGGHQPEMLGAVTASLEEPHARPLTRRPSPLPSGIGGLCYHGT